MSRTAGLGSGDYVAINNISIVALLLGLASSLALLFPCGRRGRCGGGRLRHHRPRPDPLQQRHPDRPRLRRPRDPPRARARRAPPRGSSSSPASSTAGTRPPSAQVVKQLNEHIAAKRYSEAYQTLFSDEVQARPSTRPSSPAGGRSTSPSWARSKPSGGAAGRRSRTSVRPASGGRSSAAALSSASFPSPPPRPWGSCTTTASGRSTRSRRSSRRPSPAGRPRQQPNPALPQGPSFTIPGTGNPG